MYDNKIRLSQDVLEKAELIAEEWGLKNVRAAVEAVFRRYSDDYLGGRGRMIDVSHSPQNPSHAANYTATTHANVFNMVAVDSTRKQPVNPVESAPDCEALDALDDLLAM
jgi:hypothetical protein